MLILCMTGIVINAIIKTLQEEENAIVVIIKKIPIVDLTMEVNSLVLILPKNNKLMILLIAVL